MKTFIGWCQSWATWNNCGLCGVVLERHAQSHAKVSCASAAIVSSTQTCEPFFDGGSTCRKVTGCRLLCGKSLHRDLQRTEDGWSWSYNKSAACGILKISPGKPIRNSLDFKHSDRGDTDSDSGAMRARTPSHGSRSTLKRRTLLHQITQEIVLGNCQTTRSEHGVSSDLRKMCSSPLLSSPTAVTTIPTLPKQAPSLDVRHLFP